MKYEDIMNISINIIESETVELKAATLLYELTDKQHNDLNLELFKLMGDASGEFNPSDIIDLNLNGVFFKFIKKGHNLFVN